MRVRVQIDVRKPLKRKKQDLCNVVRSYVKFKYERLSLFCFYCGRLGHNDSFYEIKMMTRADTEELGWDLSFIWLREEEEGKGKGRWGENRSGESRHRDERGVPSIEWRESKFGLSQINMAMEHDLENETLEGEEGKTKQGEMEDLFSNAERDNTSTTNRKKVEFNLLSSAAAKRQADRKQ
ncbi:hypothetical protein ES288_D01G195700v1 [Gossypium darwinii]|uniref:Zinc knuckle CX2CX4HX4C domain-containing protein n=1 Tax=Gossypium darwinii TaxID=34276 RepID=A0A5D2DRI7_GOSDA|nr:hypothetical protein ES288_D01G195700v1 [Gossypium darwinii]